MIRDVLITSTTIHEVKGLQTIRACMAVCAALAFRHPWPPKTDVRRETRVRS